MVRILYTESDKWGERQGPTGDLLGKASYTGPPLNSQLNVSEMAELYLKNSLIQLSISNQNSKF